MGVEAGIEFAYQPMNTRSKDLWGLLKEPLHHYGLDGL
jgi:hypothetical protein